jgi:flagellar biosynthesis protein
MPDERKPPRRATALRYEGEGAPKIVASGRQLVAQRIVEEAEKAGVPVRRDPALAEALAGLEIGREIGEELYVAVAEALAWAYTLDARATG